ncbi:Uncharacterised protein [Escherichia coli]|uniref:Uncharacterized protein n=1 Tax=Escherichia coli TaxID=562 RepID=A0A376U7M6_ECOLX|nr:Uncharacterised protein [Escherichia coli]
MAMTLNLYRKNCHARTGAPFHFCPDHFTDQFRQFAGILRTTLCNEHEFTPNSEATGPGYGKLQELMPRRSYSLATGRELAATTVTSAGGSGAGTTGVILIAGQAY